MATILLQTRVDNGNKGPQGKTDITSSVTVASSPGRLHYATLNGIDYTFERVGTSGGNDVYRDQTRHNL